MSRTPCRTWAWFSEGAKGPAAARAMADDRSGRREDSASASSSAHTITAKENMKDVRPKQRCWARTPIKWVCMKWRHQYPPESDHICWRSMVGRCISYWFIQFLFRGHVCFQGLNLICCTHLPIFARWLFLILFSPRFDGHSISSRWVDSFRPDTTVDDV